MRLLLLCTALLSTPSLAHAGDWPFWRGPAGFGYSPEKNVPLSWSPKENVRWKFALPEACNSTPIIWGDHVFLTQALDGGKRRALLALDRHKGTLLWQKDVSCDIKETTHKQNPPCSASPITDGKTVFAYFASGGVGAYDFQGKELWHKDLGPVLHRWGNGPSPIFYKDLLILFHGPGTPSLLMAFDKKTGAVVWKSEETPINSPIFGSWSTPVLVKVGAGDSAHDELVFPLPGDKIGGEGLFKGYDPATGKELWTCKGLGNEIYAMPVVGPRGDIIVGISGHNGPLLAIKPGGKGDVTGTHRLWQQTGKNPQRVGTGLIHDGLLFIPDAPGSLTCLEAATGKEIWKERLGGNLWGSLMLADGKIFVSNLEGETFIVSAGPKFQLLAKNDLSEAIYAAPAVANGDLFLRTYRHLYCIGKGTP